MYNNWAKYGIDVRTSRMSGNIKLTCPNCRDTRHNKGDRSLSVNLETGMFHCHHCGWSGCAQEQDEFEKSMERKEYFNQHPIRHQRKEYKKPAPKPESPYSEKLIAYMNGRGISEATMKAVGIREGMEFMPQDGREKNTIQFQYFKDGELVNIKYRTGDKHFKLTKDAELLPYNIDAIKGEKECIITEGEMDALSFYEIGYTNVVSVPNGANANLEYLDDYIEDYFEDKETIYVASDNDAKGVLLKDELVRRFGVERCKIVEYGEGCKDANEHLVKYGAESLKEALINAREVPVDGIYTLRLFEGELDALYENGLQRGFTIGHPVFDNLCSFETKRLCVVTGVPGSGKSEFIDEIAERMNILHGWKFAYFSPENMPVQIHASKIMEKITGKKFSKATLPPMEYEQAKKYIDNNFFFIYPEDGYKLDMILSRAKFLVRRRGVKGVVIDPYNRLESDMGSQSETLYISSVLDRLTNFAQINDVLVILMAHPRKMSRDANGLFECPSLYDISGSANFYNKADFGLVVNRNRAENYTEINVEKVKFRHLGSVGRCKFKYNINNGRYADIVVEGVDPEWDNSNHLVTSVLAKEKTSQTTMQPNEAFEQAPKQEQTDPFGFDDEVPF